MKGNAVKNMLLILRDFVMWKRKCWLNNEYSRFLNNNQWSWYCF